MSSENQTSQETANHEPSGGEDHDQDLAEFGYKPSLDRSIGKFASLPPVSATSPS